MFKSKKLLDKEEEFVKLNAELDLETRDLLHQVDNVMKLHEQTNTNQDSDESYHRKFTDSRSILKAFDKGEKYKSKENEEIGSKHGGCDDLIEFHFENGAEFDADEQKHSEPELLINKEEQDLEDGRHDESKKQFFTLNREKSNKNLKPGKGSIISTTNIGQGLSFQGKLVRHKSEIKLRERTENVLPESLRTLGQEGVVRFLKAKVKMLTEQIELLQKEEKKHIEKIKDLQAERERTAEDRDKWIQQANIAKNVLVKHEQHAHNVVVQLQNTQAENGHLKKEIEKLKKELKQINQSSGSNEVRLNRSIEEIEKLKTALRQAKQEEKDVRENQRKKTEELSGAVKRLDKQRVELLHAFKKQLILIDNLKKQRGMMEAGKILKSVEDDFMEFLDWHPNKV